MSKWTPSSARDAALWTFMGAVVVVVVTLFAWWCVSAETMFGRVAIIGVGVAAAALVVVFVASIINGDI